MPRMLEEIGALASCSCVANNSPLKIRGVRGVMNKRRDPKGPYYRQAGGELCPKQRELRSL